MSRTILLTWLAAASVGCTFGTTAKTFRPAQGPTGVQAQVTTAAVEFNGELIEVRANGMVLLSQSSQASARGGAPTPELVLRLIPFSSVRSSRFEQMGGGVTIAANQTPQRAVLDRLRLVSRFPHGLSESTLSQLLSKYGQTALAGIQP